jgi:hypothetical protein
VLIVNHPRPFVQDEGHILGKDDGSIMEVYEQVLFLRQATQFVMGMVLKRKQEFVGTARARAQRRDVKARLMLPAYNAQHEQSRNDPEESRPKEPEMQLQRLTDTQETQQSTESQRGSEPRGEEFQVVEESVRPVEESSSLSSDWRTQSLEDFERLDSVRWRLQSMCDGFLEEFKPLLQGVKSSIKDLPSVHKSSLGVSSPSLQTSYSALQHRLLDISIDMQGRRIKEENRKEQKYKTISKEYEELKLINMRITEKYFTSTRTISVMPRIRGKDDNDKDVASAAVKVHPDEPTTLVMSSIRTDVRGESETGKERSFTFDYVFGPTASNRAVFEKLEPLIQAVLGGRNVYIIMDGQTGAGKTHTMFEGEHAIASSAADQIFSRLNVMRLGGHECRVTCSAVQIYLGNVEDLFVHPSRQKRAELQIRQKNDLFVIEGREVKDAASSSALQPLFDLALRNRKTRATFKNTGSSRSHLVCTITVYQRLHSATVTSESQLVLVDLAGSERLPTNSIIAKSPVRQTEREIHEHKTTENERISINSGRTSLKKALRALLNGDKPALRGDLVRTSSFFIFG